MENDLELHMPNQLWLPRWLYEYPQGASRKARIRILDANSRESEVDKGFTAQRGSVYMLQRLGACQNICLR